MKKIILCTIFLLCTIFYLVGQEAPTLSSTDACADFGTATLEVNFEHDFSAHPLPYNGSYYNTTTGDYEEFTITSNPVSFSNLAAGEYEFQIYISDEEIMEFCWEVFSYDIQKETTIDTYNADCYADNGKIVITTSNTLLGYGTPIIAKVLNQSGVAISEKNIWTGLTLIKDLEGGEYDLEIEMPNGCSALIPFFIDENKLDIPYDIVSINKSCQQDGSIDIHLDPSTGPYDITWQNMDTGEEYFTEDLSNVYNGTYCLHVEKVSGNGCEFSDSCLIIDSSLGFRNVGIVHVCDSLSLDGSIFMNTLHDSYSYKWDTEPTQTEPLLENLGPGKYCVTVTDTDTDCEHLECFTIIALQDSISVDFQTEEVCPLEENGAIALNIQPYTQNTTVHWQDLPLSSTNILERNNLKAGDYYLTVSNECITKELSITLEYDCSCALWIEGGPEYKIKDDCMDGSADGSIIFSDPEGYSFTWSTGSTSSQLYGLSSGDFIVTITENDSQCEKVIPITIAESEGTEVAFENIQTACPFTANGQAEVIISGEYYEFYWNDQGVGGDDFFRDDLVPGTHYVLVEDACGHSQHAVSIPRYEVDLSIEDITGCDPFELIDFAISGDNPPFEIQWENGDSGSLTNAVPGEYAYTITDALGCEFKDQFEIKEPIEVLSKVKACPGINNGSITLQINNPAGDIVHITYDFGPCGECEDFPLIEPTSDSILAIQMDNLPGDIPFTFNIDFGYCNLTQEFIIGEEQWEKVFISSEEIDGIIYCTYDKVCQDITIEDGIVEPATIDHWSVQDNDSGHSWQGFGGCGETNLNCGLDSVGVLTTDPIKMRAAEAIAFYQRLGIEFHEFWEAELKENYCRYAWVCPNGNVTPSFYSGNFFGGGTYQGVSTEGLEEGCQEVLCEYDFGLFSISDNFVICDSFEFLPPSIEPYVNDSGEESEEKCKDPIEYNAFSIINFYQNHSGLVESIIEGSELLDFILEHLDNPAQNCASLSVCADDFSILHTDIDDIDCDHELLDPPYVEDENGNTVLADYCETYRFDDDNVYILCPTDCGPDSDKSVGCWYINIVPIETGPPGVSGGTGGPKSQTRTVAIQPQSEPTSFYTFTPYITEFGETIYKPLLRTKNDEIKFNILSNGSYQTFPANNIRFSYEDFRDGFHHTVFEEENTYIISSGYFSNLVSSKIRASEYLELLSFDHDGNSSTLTGKFSGHIYYNDQPLLSSTAEIPFSIKLNESLEIIELDYFEEGNTFSFHSNGKFVKIATIGDNSSSVIKISSEIEVLEYLYNPKTKDEYLVIKGEGSVSVGEHIHYRIQSK